MSLQALAIKTDILHPGDDLLKFCIKHLSQLAPNDFADGSIVAVTSKIVALAENALVAKDSISKEALVRREADIFLGEGGYGCFLTIKEGLMIASSGIDESNAEGDFYILYPKDPHESARKLCQGLKAHFGFKKLGVILTDSKTEPLRKGVTGVALSHYGFKGLRNLIGEADLFGRKLKMTQVNVADSLAVTAVFLMGESAEKCPLAVIRGAAVEYGDSTEKGELSIKPEDDLFSPLLSPLLQRKP